jgi:hypothetical protein
MPSCVQSTDVPSSHPAFYVEIPSGLSLWSSYYSMVRIPLPIEARTRLGIVERTLLAGLVCLGAGVVFLMLKNLLLASWEQPSAPTFLLTAIFLPMILFAIWPIAIWCKSKLKREKQPPEIIIDQDGLFDRRCMAAPLRWSEISHAIGRVRKGYYYDVRLWLARSSSSRERRLMSDITINLYFIETPSRLAFSILALVKKSGGSVSFQHPLWGSELAENLRTTTRQLN